MLIPISQKPSKCFFFNRLIVSALAEEKSIICLYLILRYAKTQKRVFEQREIGDTSVLTAIKLDALSSPVTSHKDSNRDT